MLSHITQTYSLGKAHVIVGQPEILFTHREHIDEIAPFLLEEPDAALRDLTDYQQNRNYMAPSNIIDSVVEACATVVNITIKIVHEFAGAVQTTLRYPMGNSTGSGCRGTIGLVFCRGHFDLIEKAVKSREESPSRCTTVEEESSNQETRESVLETGDDMSFFNASISSSSSSNQDSNSEDISDADSVHLKLVEEGKKSFKVAII